VKEFELKPSELTTYELTKERTRVRWRIRILEQWPARTLDEDKQLQRLREYLRELMVEAGKRFIAPRGESQ
jgi:hypothetical protein